MSLPTTSSPASSALPLVPRCDLFCTVVDNFGDIGVCWRLARQLVREHGWSIRLWVDDLTSFRHLRPDIDPSLARQRCDGVDVRRWNADFGPITDDNMPGDIVIEAFACNIPDVCVQAMHARKKAGNAPVWINLEYLSAEDWVDDCHLQKSLHPQLGLLKTFFFPGFTERTGGLIRERELFSRRDAFLASPELRDAWWQRTIGLPAAPKDALIVSLFAYENPALAALLAQWADSVTPIVCLVPQGRIAPAVGAWFGRDVLAPGESVTRGALTVYGLPFVPQTEFDALLWACDLNFVRGEDSFVRAQWAAKPFVWHIYAQDENAHHGKLDAFLGRYLAARQDDTPDAASLSHGAREALRTFWHLWNGYASTAPDWPALAAALPELNRHARAWANAQAAHPDLARQLASFAEIQVK
ncbi:elongation factor P maturation arginine rhamnosyltransferase EarP [Pandoraea communis]|uniref:Protein-arginine rhamnosyltransferase n=1 Tax=Pandoraea communis TaxID=2508297 RepID=A0A5E4Y4Y5_9BURK|nr:elongation factor P maturation arginine rhamnosyltransferase EarP [Pandoraea communis]MDM8357064.1 elongation factor P maturation arginine rhamnosyltransferase EarP [Pandoraea communis]VVE43577.1 elongation factor P maturation arginine rhamnosyltransferase EarP [Pandoraea communis]